MPSPICFRHMVLAIFEGPSVKGAGSQKFDAALKIALASLLKNGHVNAPEVEGDYETITLTAKGQTLEKFHRSGQNHLGGTALPKRTQRYLGLYALWATDYRKGDK